MLDAINLDAGDRSAGDAGEQRATQRVAQRVAEAGF